MIFSTDYIPGISNERLYYCGFFYCPINKTGFFNKDAFKDVNKMLSDLDAEALIGAKMFNNGDTLYIYGTAVKILD